MATHFAVHSLGNLHAKGACGFSIDTQTVENARERARGINQDSRNRYTRDTDQVDCQQCRRTTAFYTCLLYTSPSPRDRTRSRMPSSA